MVKRVHNLLLLVVLCLCQVSHADELSSNELEIFEESQHPSKGQYVDCGRPSQFNLTVDDYKSGGYPMPWDVLIRHKTNKNENGDDVVCLGAIVQLETNQHHSRSSTRVMTAENCLLMKNTANGAEQSAEDLFVSVRLGRGGGNEFGKENFEIEEFYAVDEPVSSVRSVILKLKTPIKFGKGAQPVCLPESDEYLYPSKCYLSAWMKTDKHVRSHSVILDRPLPCSKNQYVELEDLVGICGLKQSMPKASYNGAPLACTIDGHAYLYGFYVTERFAQVGSNRLLTKRILFTAHMVSNAIKKHIRNNINSQNAVSLSEEPEFVQTEFSDGANKEELDFIASSYGGEKLKPVAMGSYAAGSVVHVFDSKNRQLKLSCTATFIGNSDQSMHLVTSTDCFSIRSTGGPKIYTGKATADGRSVTPVVRTVQDASFQFLTTEPRPFGFALLSLNVPIDVPHGSGPLKIVDKETNVNDMRDCRSSGINSEGKVREFAVKLVSPDRCSDAQKLYNYDQLYCAIQPKGITIHTTGSPLICKNAMGKVLFGVRAQIQIPSSKDTDLEYVTYTPVRFL